jgi:RNA polymerase sigma-70 factor (ECF subfamily)
LEAHGAQLHALLTRLTLRPAVADDLLQDLFLKLHGANGFARASNPKAYLFKTAINLAFDWRRKQRTTEALPAESTAAGEAPLDRMIDEEEMDQVLQALQNLPELKRRVMILRYLQQQDYAEIAREVGKTEHQVRGLCSKAIAQLQSQFRPRVHAPKPCEVQPKE